MTNEPRARLILQGLRTQLLIDGVDKISALSVSEIRTVTDRSGTRVEIICTPKTNRFVVEAPLTDAELAEAVRRGEEDARLQKEP